MWLLLAALFPAGLYFGLRYHKPATLLMSAYVVVMFMGIALRSGNVGTLIRHRGLIVPFVLCLSAVALCHLLLPRGARAHPSDRTLSVARA
jgi:hypothetical protein